MQIEVSSNQDQQRGKEGAQLGGGQMLNENILRKFSERSKKRRRMDGSWGRVDSSLFKMWSLGEGCDLNGVIF